LLILGTLVAGDWRLPSPAVTALAIGLGLGLGMRNGVAMQQAGAGLLGLLGMLAALFVLIALVAACVVSLHQQWARMAVRVAGSWLATIGLLMLGWALRGGNRRIVLHTAPIVVLATLVGLHATTQTQEALKADGAELPKELQNPMATLIGMPLQAHWGVEPRQASLGVLGGVPPEVVCGAPPVVIRSKTCAHGMGDNASRGMTMLTEFVGIAKERARLKAQYLPKFKQVLPPRKAVRFYQMENKLDIAILAEMAQAIPLAR
jgi:hypothetical protein